jgi:hypothetical protein
LSSMLKIVQNLSKIICNSKYNPKQIPKKTMDNLKVLINSNVANILAVVSPVPAPVKSITIKQTKAAMLGEIKPKLLSMPLKKDDFK